MKTLIMKRAITVEFVTAVCITALFSVHLVTFFTSGVVLPLYAGIVIMTTVLAFLYPRAGIYALILLSFLFEQFFGFEPLTIGRTTYKIYPFDFLFSAIILRTFFDIFTGQLRLSLRKVDYIFALFLLFALGRFIFALSQTHTSLALALSSIKSYFFYALVYYVITLYFDTKEKLMNLLLVLFCGGTLLCGFILYGVFSGEGLWVDITALSTQGVRTLGSSHAFFVSIVLLLTSAFVLHNKGLRKSTFLWTLITLWLIGIIGSLMRHLWIALILALGTFALLSPKDVRMFLTKTIKRYLGAALLLVFFAAFFALLLPDTAVSDSVQSSYGSLKHRIVSLVDTQNDSSASWRYIVWREALAQFSHSPLFGTGFGYNLFYEIESENFRDITPLKNIHNSFLVLLVQLGVMGFLFFSALLVWHGVRAYQSQSLLGALFLSLLIFYVVIAQFQPYLEQNFKEIFFWLILAGARIVSSDTFKKS